MAIVHRLGNAEGASCGNALHRVGGSPGSPHHADPGVFPGLPQTWGPFGLGLAGIQPVGRRAIVASRFSPGLARGFGERRDLPNTIPMAIEMQGPEG